MGTVRAAALAVALACLGMVECGTSSALATPAPPALGTPSALGASAPLTSSGVGIAAQQVEVPDGTMLVAASGEQTYDLTVADVGSYAVSADTLVFRPALGFTGAYAVLVRTTDATGQTDEATYTPTVAPPLPPSAPELVTAGPYGQRAQCLVAVPAQGRAVLVDAAGQPTLDEVDAAGEFSADPATGVVAFTPAGGFTGSATIGYRVTDAYGQSASGGCTVTIAAPPAPVVEQVAAPAAPVATRARTRGAVHRQQVVRLAVPVGGTATLVDADATTLHVYRAGQGSYALDPATETITFTPSRAFHGVGSVTFRITDAYGRSAENAYTPTVLAAVRRPPAAHRPPVSHPVTRAVDRLAAAGATTAVRHSLPQAIRDTGESMPTTAAPSPTATTAVAASGDPASIGVTAVVAAVVRPALEAPNAAPSAGAPSPSPDSPAEPPAVAQAAHHGQPGSGLASGALVVGNLAVGGAALVLHLRRRPL